MEETDADIMEAIDNLHFLRFYKKEIIHSISELAVGNSSKYYQDIMQNNQLEEWSENPYVDLLPSSYFEKQDQYKLFYFTKSKYNNLWYLFEKIDKHYSDNHYEYILIKHDNVITYQELLNRHKIHEIDFDDIITWYILTLCNNKVRSISDILQCCQENQIFYEENDLLSIISCLQKSHLIYANKDLSEIVSIINTDLLS